MSRPVTTRREFLEQIAATTAAITTTTAGVAGIGAAAGSAAGSGIGIPKIPTALLGRTNRVLPRLGFGGYPMGLMDSDEEAIQLVLLALDLGVRYIDTAHNYYGGRSEWRIGQAILEAGIEREELFVATKTKSRDAAGAREDLERSLTRLGLDYVDSLQIHDIRDDVLSIFGPDGALRALEDARDEGLIRHIGITSHVKPDYILEAIKRYEFDTALVPVNPNRGKYIGRFLPTAEDRGLGVIAMKIYQGGKLLEPGLFTVDQLVHFALTQTRVDIIEPGPDALVEMVRSFWAIIAVDMPTTDR